MKRIFKVTVYETIIESFDCEVEIEVPDGASDDDIQNALDTAVEDRRVNGADRRDFLEVQDTEYEVTDQFGDAP